MNVKKKENDCLRSVFLAGILIILTASSLFIVSAENNEVQADDSELAYVDGDGLKWIFQLTSTGAKLTGVEGTSGKILTIPGEVWNGNADDEEHGSWTVISIGPELGKNLKGTVLKVIMPSSVESIESGGLGSGAFSNASVFSRLRVVDFGENSVLGTIGDYAFAGAGTDKTTESSQGVELGQKVSLSTDILNTKGDHEIKVGLNTTTLELSIGSLNGSFKWGNKSNYLIPDLGNLYEKVELPNGFKVVVHPTTKKNAVMVSGQTDNTITIKLSGAGNGDSLKISTTYTNGSSEVRSFVFKFVDIIEEDSLSEFTVSLPNSVTSIGDGSFSAAVGVDLNEGLEKIGGAGSLGAADSITIPSTVTSIGTGAFKSGAKITFAEGSSLKDQYNKETGDFLSKDGTKLLWTVSSSENYTFPGSVSYVDADAFLNNTAVKTITIPAGLSCGMFPFNGSAIESVNFGDGVAEIPDYMFAKTKLTSVEIPASVVSIGTKAFYDISTLESVTFASDSKISEIKDYAFFNNGIKTVTFNSSASGYSVDIGIGAFYKNKNLTSVVVDEGFSINTIGYAAFAKKITDGVRTAPSFGPKGTVGVEIPAEVTSIGDYAFSALGFPGSAEQEPSIGFIRSVNEVQSLTATDASVSFESGSKVITIGKYALYVATLSSIDLSECSELETIDVDAFAAYKTITLPTKSSIKTLYGISYHVAAANISGKDGDSKEFNTLTIPASVEAMYPIKNVDTISFEEGSHLRTLDDRTSSGVTSAQCFDLSNCLELESVAVPINGTTTLPAGLYSITFSTSTSPSDLKGTISNASRIIVDNSNLKIDSSTIAVNSNLLGKHTLTIDGTNDRFSIVADCLVMKNGNEMVLEGVANAGLKDVEVSADSVITSIADRAFSGSSIESLSIKKGVSVGSSIFDGCTKISSVSLLVGPQSMTLAGDSFLIGDDISVSFYLLPGYDIEASSKNTTFYLAYGQEGSHVFVPTTVDGQSYAVKQTASSVGSTSLELTFDGGYAMADMAFTASAGTYKIDGSVITVTSDGDSILTVAKKPRVSDDMVQVTFYTSGGNVNGSESYTVSIPRGCTVIDSDIPTATYSGHTLKSWHLKGSDSPYDFDSVLNGNVFLIASWEDVGKYVVTISTPAADVLYNGNAVTSIDITDGMESVTLTYKVRDGYEVRAWVVSDGSSSSTTAISKNSPALTLTDLDKDLTISMEYRYASSSTGLLPVVNRDLPSASEIRSAVEVFEFGGSVDTSGSQWIGHSSVPLIVDGYIYVRAGGASTSEPGRIYKIESDTGYIVASAESSGTRAFYHQVSYGNGVVFDYLTGNAYDLDLNPIYSVDRSVGCVEYYDGWFYTSGSTLYRFPADASQTGTVTPVKVGTFEKQVYGSYGFTSSVFIGDYIYRVYVDGVNRGITAMCLTDGTKVSSVALTGMENLMLDDGWISEYNGTIYLTGYTTGLFGVVSTTDKQDRVGYVTVNNLSFGTPGYYEFKGNTSFAGEFIVANGFGFVKAGSLYVFDLRQPGAVPSDDTLLGKADTFPGGHGSIVLDVTDATESNGWMTYVYSIPYYTNETTMAVMEAHLGDNGKFVFNLVTTTNMQKNEYNSQAVRSDYDGRMVWYNDSGHIFSYSVPSKNNYYFYVSDGTTSVWYKSSGATAADALKALGSDVARLDSANALASVWGSSNADGWTLSMLKLESLGKQQYSWTSLENLYDAANDTNHYYAILKNCNVPDAGTEFAYIGDDGKQATYKFADNIGDRSLVGKTLISGTEVSVIRFYSGETEIEGSALIGKTGSAVNGDFPQMYRSGWSGHWEDSSGTVTELPSTFSSGTTTYKFVWVQSSYDMTISCTESGSMSYFTIGTERKAGEGDVVEGHILLIAGYDSGKYVNLYSAELGFGSNGNASTRMGVSTEGLISVHAYLINGTPLGAFESYGQCTYAVTTG